MARPRRGKALREGGDHLLAYLATGEYPTDGDDQLAILMLSEADMHQQWEQHREAVMAEWDAPGCRPWAWWKYDAPRIPAGRWPGCFYDGTLPEPRRFIGGSGCPKHERLAYVPASSFGIWDWEGGSMDDPPRFESQYDYLTRNGLLLPREARGPELQPLPLRWYIPR